MATKTAYLGIGPGCPKKHALFVCTTSDFLLGTGGCAVPQHAEAICICLLFLSAAASIDPLLAISLLACCCLQCGLSELRLAAIAFKLQPEAAKCCNSFM